MLKLLLLLPLFFACTVALPSTPNACMVIDFESGAINSLGDYEQEPFILQFTGTDISGSVENGALVFSSDSVYFQWFMVLRNPGNQKFYFDFKSVQLTALSLDLTFVGDDFDTLRVNTAGLLIIPDSLFIGTTQIHCFGRAVGLSVDDIVVCEIR